MFKETQLFDISDFSKYQWTEILELTNPKKCKNYSQIFREKAEKYLSNGDNVAQKIFLFLSRVTASWIGHCVISEEIISKEFSDRELDILRELVTKIIDCELKARIADILWICRKRDFERARPIEMAKIALEAYLESARTLEDASDWMSCYKRLKRAAQLAPLIDGKKSTKMRTKIAQHIDDLINRYEKEENEFLTGSSMKVLQEELGKKHLTDIWDDVSSYANKYAAIAAQKAIYAENIQQFLTYHKVYYKKKATAN